MKKGPAYLDKSEITRFAIIGDVHGCYEELTELIEKLKVNDGNPTRILVFVGDLVDRGPKPVEVLQLVMNLVKQGRGYSVKGNHDEKLFRWLSGKNVQLWHGLDYTTQELKKQPEQFRNYVKQFILDLPFQLILDNDSVLVAHAGLNERLQKTDSDAMRSFALYGDTTGKLDNLGLPVRLNWAEKYQGRRLVVYGHTPVTEPRWENNTVNIDTGCAFGGKLTALLYPEKEMIQVSAKRQYAESKRPV